MILKHICFPESEDTRLLLAGISRLSERENKSFSMIARDALLEYNEKHTRLLQSRLEDFHGKLEQELDRRYREFISPNSRRHTSWLKCLSEEGLITETSVAYSESKHWLKGEELAKARTMAQELIVRTAVRTIGFF